MLRKLWQLVQVNLKVTIDTLRSFCIRIQEFRFEERVTEVRLFVEKSS